MAHPRYPTLLFDLDGTLLDVEMRGFLDGYFPLAAARFGAPREARAIASAMGDAARAMMQASDGAHTVDLVFLDIFAAALGRDREDVRLELEAFHRQEFERMSRLVRPIPGARALLERALGFGCRLVLATNPVFFLAAIRARMRWAGIDDLPFSLVTGAEQMRWTKPHAGYYRQILEMTGERAGDCLMVGDDPRMDMAARQVGIATWLAVHDGTAGRDAPLADHRGSLGQLADWLEVA